MVVRRPNHSAPACGAAGDTGIRHATSRRRSRRPGSANDGKEVLAAYIDRSARRWDARDRRHAARSRGRDKRRQHRACGPGRAMLPFWPRNPGAYSSLLRLVAPKSRSPSLPSGPLSYLGELDAAHAFAVSRSGAASIIDLSSPTAPKVEADPRARRRLLPNARRWPVLRFASTPTGRFASIVRTRTASLLEWPRLPEPNSPPPTSLQPGPSSSPATATASSQSGR